jgi:hypothetical protein
MTTRVPTTFPRGLAAKLKTSRQRLALLERRNVMLTMRQPPLPKGLRAAIEGFAIEAGRLEGELTELAEQTSGRQRAEIEPMIVHARRLAERYIEATTPMERE